ncbi:DUF2752 domain-containing protein [Armatimonas rosea]|uniref:DUF2752 domain-containing protein n=1 Tax=Armatimonas rosea TaxID=685828 RepID=UPI0016152310|nr:DUF2752 domain-containing protein [Armatimonas rosea]
MRSTLGVLRESVQKGGRVLWHPAPFLLLALFLVPTPGLDNKSLLGLPPLCPTKALFHLPCPGCGMSRSLVCCAHGELVRAFWLHPLGPVFFGLLIGAVVLRFFPRLQPSPKLLRVSSWVLIVLMLLLWVTRLLGWLPKPP